MIPTRHFSLPLMLGAPSVHTLASLDQLRCFFSKHTKVHSEYPYLLCGHGVVVRRAFPIKNSFLLGTSPKHTTEKHRWHLCFHALWCWNMAQHAAQPTTCHIFHFQCPPSTLLFLNQKAVILLLFKNRILVKACEQYFCWSQKAVFYNFWALSKTKKLY